MRDQGQTIESAYRGEVVPSPMPMDAGTVTGSIQNPVPQTIRDINIHPLSHGYVVSVGCQSFAIENAFALVAKLTEYIHNPAGTEQKWNEGKLF